MAIGNRSGRRLRCTALAWLLGGLLSPMGSVFAPAGACSLKGADLFRPTLVRFEEHPGPGQKSGGGGPYWEPIPAPIIEVVKLTRGTAPRGSSCDDAGTLTLSVTLPNTSTYTISQFGIYFRVLSGTLPDVIFPDLPLVGVVEGDRMRLLLAWLDGHPSRKIPLDLKVEAFLVTDGLNIGPAIVFDVKG